MKISPLALTLLLALPAATGCAGLGGAKSSAVDNNDAVPELPPNTGAKAVVVVKPFEWKGSGSTAKFKSGDSEWEFSVAERQEYGMELSALLEGALTNSTYFAVASRSVLGMLDQERGLDNRGDTDLTTGSDDGGLVRPDLIVSIHVQEFNPHAGGSSIAGGLLASLTQSIVGVASSYDTEAGKVVLQVQLTDRRTGINVADESVSGYAEESSFKIGGFGLGGGALAGGALSKWSDKPMGAAISKAIARAVVKIQEKTPKRMYTFEG